jgi:hypothetical protein
MKEVLARMESICDYEWCGLLAASTMTTNALGRRNVVVEVVVAVNILLQHMIEVTIIHGVAPGPAHLAVDA